MPEGVVADGRCPQHDIDVEQSVQVSIPRFTERMSATCFTLCQACRRSVEDPNNVRHLMFFDCSYVHRGSQKPSLPKPTAPSRASLVQSSLQDPGLDTPPNDPVFNDLPCLNPFVDEDDEDRAKLEEYNRDSNVCLLFVSIHLFTTIDVY